MFTVVCLSSLYQIFELIFVFIVGLRRKIVCIYCLHPWFLLLVFVYFIALLFTLSSHLPCV